MKASSTLKYLTTFCAAMLLSACGGGSGGSSGSSGSDSTEVTYVVTAAAGEGGSIAPASIDVTAGSNAEFTLTPASGYVIAGAGGCGEGALVDDTYTTPAVTADCEVTASFAPAFSSVGGSVSGLNPGTSVTLQNNGGDDLVVPADGGFSFATQVAYGGDYSVTVAAQPFLQECSVSNASGTISGADVGGVAVSCVTVAPPAAPEPSLGYGIKQLQFSWAAVPGATYYRLSEDPDGSSGYTVVADNLTTTAVNHDIALYNRINARYMVEACNDFDCSASTELFMANHLVDAIGYFKASNTEAGDNFGNAVSLSADGATLAVGAPEEDSAATGVNGDETDNSATRSGAVYVFVRSDAGWVQQAYLKAPERVYSFGQAVSLSADGNTVAVGASDEAYVFNRSGSAWVQQGYLTAGVATYTAFGLHVSISADGNTLAVGADYDASAATGVNGDETDTTARESGAVYLFNRSGDVWSREAYIKASNTAAGDRFGFALSLSGDGNTLAVGAIFEDSIATGVNGDETDNSALESGAVYVFTRSSDGWLQQAYLKASDTVRGGYFGTSLSLSADGATLAVGASGYMVQAVYIFTSDSSSWAQRAYLKAGNTDTDDEFADSVSLSADGTILAVGAVCEASIATGVNGDGTDNSASSSGAVYLFSSDGSQWVQQAYLKASNTGAGDYIGDDVSLSADGTALAVGAQYEESIATGVGGDGEDNSAVDSGAVYLY